MESSKAMLAKKQSAFLYFDLAARKGNTEGFWLVSLSDFKDQETLKRYTEKSALKGNPHGILPKIIILQ
jgi:hypothetical protein